MSELASESLIQRVREAQKPSLRGTAMNEDELRALRHAADGTVLFHNGLWGAPAGYRWAALDGSSAGRLPQWACEALDLLERRRLVAIQPVTGARDTAVAITSDGMRLLAAVDQMAA